MNMQERQQFYRQLVEAQTPRLLSLLDRQAFSPSFGCMDRRFWLHRTADFPSSAAQQGLESLAFIYSQKNISPHEKETLKVWILAMLEFTLRIQNTDGSFDEWYPGEHGWAGPTGYILSSVARAVSLLDFELPPALMERLKSSFLRGGKFLSRFEEEDVLANHQAMALLGLASGNYILKSKTFDEEIEKLWKRLSDSFSPEGWSLEYDGADPGYQTATLSFLARLHRLWPDPRIEKLVPQQLEFLSHFFYPDGDFAGPLGSRGTRNVFVFGFEYWGQFFPLAEKLAAASCASLKNEFAPRPQDQEDHYLIYRMPEFFESLTVTQTKAVGRLKLAFEREPFEVYWPESGFWIKKTLTHYWIANLKKGASYGLYAIESKKCLASDHGVTARFKQRILTSNWLDPDKKIEFTKEKKISSGYLVEVKTPLFTPLGFVAFRLFMLAFSRNPVISRKLKSWIRRRLMIGTKRSKLIAHRTIEIDQNEISIRDQISGSSIKELSDVWWGGEFLTRVVPQSRYFVRKDLDFRPRHEKILSQSKLENINKISLGI